MKKLYSLKSTGPRHHDLKAVRELSEQELDQYEQGIKFFMDFRRARSLHDLVEANQKEFNLEVTEFHENDFKENKDPVYLWNTGKDINRRLVNYLATVRLFLDHNEARLKRIYGKNRPPFTAFKDACRQAYDSSFAYRFLYKLRNYSQHCGPPIGHIRVKGDAGDDPDGPITHYTTVMFDRDELLEEGADVWTNVRRDLENSPPYIDVRILVKEMTEKLKQVNAISITAEIPEMKRMGRKILNIVKDGFLDGGSPAVGELIQEGSGWSIDLSPPPLDILSKLGLLPK
jgi:hypothetical protein